MFRNINYDSCSITTWSVSLLRDHDTSTLPRVHLSTNLMDYSSFGNYFESFRGYTLHSVKVIDHWNVLITRQYRWLYQYDNVLKRGLSESKFLVIKIWSISKFPVRSSRSIFLNENDMIIYSIKIICSTRVSSTIPSSIVVDTFSDCQNMK